MEHGPVRWGIIGPGLIARAFADGLARTSTGTLVALGARSPDRPQYAAEFPGIPVMSIAALLGSPDVEAVYIATPHPDHAIWAIRAAAAGKHVLCEKPMGISAFEAEVMFAAARAADVFMGEAFMYRFHPQTMALRDLIAEGVIGEVRLVRSSFGYDASRDVGHDHRTYANALAGGGILDVGCYPVSMARLVAGVAQGTAFADPVSVKGAATLGPTGVDEWASAVLHFAGGLIAEVSCSVSLLQDNVLRIYGSAGRIEVADFWFASGRQGGVGRIEIIAPDGVKRVVEVAEPRWLYSFEAEAASRAIRAGRRQFDPPGLGWDDTLGNMAVLDAWRREAGLAYVIETEERRARLLDEVGMVGRTAASLDNRSG